MLKTEMEMAGITKIYNTFDYPSYLEQPEELYHYTSLGTLQKILEKRQLRFTNRAYLNDKTEGTYVLSLCYQVSFSYKSDSLSMWNYYAQGGGCNLQFSKDFMETFRSKLVDPAGMPLVFLCGNVIYNPEKQLSILKDIFAKFEPYGLYPSTKTLYFCMTYCILKMGSFFKHPSFEDERESRIVLNLSLKEDSNEFNQLAPLADGKPYKCNVYTKQGMMVPYVDIDFDLKYLQSIMLSPTANFEKVKEGVYRILSSLGIETFV